MQTITINGKSYPLPKINYRTIIQLEDLGFEANKAEQKMFKSYAALVALTANVDIEEAADLIEAHCNSGGSLADFNVLMNNIVESGFFTKLLGDKNPKSK